MKRLALLVMCLLLFACSEYQGEADGSVDCSKKDPDAVFDSPYTCWYGQAKDTESLELCDNIMRDDPTTDGWAACVGTVSAMVDDEEACARELTLEKLKKYQPSYFTRNWNPSMTPERIKEEEAKLEARATKSLKGSIRHCISMHWKEKHSGEEMPSDFLGYDSYKT